MQEGNNISIFGANVVYLLTAVLLLTVGSYVQHKNIQIGLLITEYILVLLPPFIYIYLEKENSKQVFRLNPLKTKHGLLIILIIVLSYPVALFFNIIIMIFISTFGKIEQMPIPVASNIFEYLILMFIIAISAGICEEVLFRGLLMRAYETLGKTRAIWISAFLFGIIHFNVQNFAGPVVLGIIFGYLVYETNSLFAAVIGHITNNGVALTISFLTNLYGQNNFESNISSVQMPDTVHLIAGAVFIGIIAVVSGAGAYFLFQIIRKETMLITHETVPMQKKQSIEEKKFTLLRYSPVLLIVVIYLYIAYIRLS